MYSRDCEFVGMVQNHIWAEEQPHWRIRALRPDLVPPARWIRGRVGTRRACHARMGVCARALLPISFCQKRAPTWVCSPAAFGCTWGKPFPSWHRLHPVLAPRTARELAGRPLRTHAHALQNHDGGRELSPLRSSPHALGLVHPATSHAGRFHVPAVRLWALAVRLDTGHWSVPV